MDNNLLCSLFDEIVSIAEEENQTHSAGSFRDFVCDMLPLEILHQLELINGGCTTFLEDLWLERYSSPLTQVGTSTPSEDLSEDIEVYEQLPIGVCVICERDVRLTKHHVFPREVHKSMTKKGFDSKKLNTTIDICRMCHNTVHRLFTNTQLASDYYSVGLLLGDDRMFRYAKWASLQKSRR